MIRDDSKQILLSVFGVALLLVAIVGVSYAVFIFTSNSTTENTIQTGTIAFQYLESNNTIQINDSLPISDDVGIHQTEVFDFSISSTIHGNISILYEIRAKSIAVSNPLDSKFVKIYLEKEQEGQYQPVLKPTSFQVNPNTSLLNSNIDLDTMLLYTGRFSTIGKDQVSYNDVFRLRMWVDDDYLLENTSKSFKLKIDVYASM